MGTVHRYHLGSRIDDRVRHHSRSHRCHQRFSSARIAFWSLGLLQQEHCPRQPKRPSILAIRTALISPQDGRCHHRTAHSHSVDTVATNRCASPSRRVVPANRLAASTASSLRASAFHDALLISPRLLPSQHRPQHSVLQVDPNTLPPRLAANLQRLEPERLQLVLEPPGPQLWNVVVVAVLVEDGS